LQLPKHIDEQLVLSAISVEKDVDGFHPLNMGRLCMKVSSSRLVWYCMYCHHCTAVRYCHPNYLCMYHTPSLPMLVLSLPLRHVVLFHYM
jgi:hypothetical protein